MILKRMKRRHNREQIIEFCARVKAARPEVVFGADIIAGFPTETDEMFANTLKVIDEANLTWLHIFPYSERDGTPAARMPQVAKAIRKERASLLRQRGLEMVKAHYRMQVGKVHEVIVEQNNMGRSQDFSQVKLITDATPGEVIKVKIKEYSDDCLIA
jgi:threonylcarbamoyladenosine tRNA methylthiotransferase MtaB